MNNYYNKYNEKRFLIHLTNHIQNVRFYLQKLKKFYPSINILKISNEHDITKIHMDEYIGWVLMYEKDNDIEYKDTPIKNKIIKETLDNHYSKNRHHPEHFKNINNMTDVDLCEMVCDWASHCKYNNISLLDYSCNLMQKKYDFNNNQINNINNYIYKFQEII